MGTIVNKTLLTQKVPPCNISILDPPSCTTPQQLTMNNLLSQSSTAKELNRVLLPVSTGKALSPSLAR